MTVPTYVEQPLYLSSGDDDLFAILTAPIETPNDTTVMLLPGGAWMPSMHRNRMFARLARNIAEKGYRALRVDYHGTGESTGQVDVYDLASPHADDVAAIAKELANRGHDRIVVAGTCFGARSAVAAASKIDGLAGLAMVGVPFEADRGASKSLGWHVAETFKKSTWSKLRQPGTWRKYLRVARGALRRAMPWNKTAGEGAATPWFVNNLIELIDRGVPVLLLYGAEGKNYQQFLKARNGRLGEAIDRAGDLVSVVVAEGEVHGFITLEAQQTTIDTVSSWLESLAANPPEGA